MPNNQPHDSSPTATAAVNKFTRWQLQPVAYLLRKRGCVTVHELARCVTNPRRPPDYSRAKDIIRSAGLVQSSERPLTAGGNARFVRLVAS